MTDNETNAIDLTAAKEKFVKRSNYAAIKKINDDPRSSVFLVPLIRAKFMNLAERKSAPGYNYLCYSFYGVIPTPDPEGDEEYKQAYDLLVKQIKMKWAFLKYGEEIFKKDSPILRTVNSQFAKWCDTTKYGVTWDGNGPRGETEKNGELHRYEADCRVFKANNSGVKGPNVVYDEKAIELKRGTPEWELRIKAGHFYSIAINLYYAKEAKDITGGLGAVQFVQYAPSFDGELKDGRDSFAELPAEDPLELMGEGEDNTIDSASTSADLDDEIPF